MDAIILNENYGSTFDTFNTPLPTNKIIIFSKFASIKSKNIIL